MADGNLTERQKIAKRLAEAQAKAKEQEDAYNAKLAGKLEEVNNKVTKKEEAIEKAEASLAKHQEQLLDLEVLKEQYTSELAEVEANSTASIETPSFD